MSGYGIHLFGGLGGEPLGSISPGSFMSGDIEATKQINVYWGVNGTVRKYIDIDWAVNGYASKYFDVSWSVNSNREVSYEEFVAWLSDPDVIRCILVEIKSVSTVKYVSNIGYISGPDQVTKNRAYVDHLIGIPEIVRSIDGSSAVGGIQIFNDGSYDDWLDLPWVGHSIKIYMGDPTWPRDDFMLVVSGVNSGISMPSNNTIEFGIRDKFELLDEYVQSEVDVNGNLKPFTINTPFNCEPVLEDAPTLRYRYHIDGGAVCNAGNVRDNGLSVSFTDQGDGSFILTASPTPNGRITCDPTGPASGTPADIVELLALRASSISSLDIDYTSFAAYATSPVMSIYIDEYVTIAEIIQNTMRSTGGVAIFDRLGLLQLKRLDVPGTSVFNLYPDDIYRFGMLLDDVEQPYDSVRLNYSRNWSVQDADSLAGAVSAANKDLFSTEYQVSTADNSLNKTDFPIDNIPEPIDTYIDNSTDANAESSRRAILRSVKRKVYKIEAKAKPFAAQIGDTITVHYPRYGFDNGLDCVVVGLGVQLTNDKSTIYVWL